MQIQNFHEALERDLARLTAEIKVEQERSVGRELTEKEIVKRSIQSFAAAVPAATPSPGSVQSQSSDEKENVNLLPAYLKDKTDNRYVKLEIEKLIDIVFHENLEKAIAESKRHPAFVQDAFHDSLVDKLLPELKKRGAI